MTSIVVASAEKKTSKTGKPYVFFNDADGHPWTSWEAEVWPLIKPGAKFDIEWVQKGEYKNISSMVFRGETEPPPLPEPPINHEKQESIEAQNARTNLTNLSVGGFFGRNDWHPLELALVSQLASLAGLNFDGSYKVQEEPKPISPEKWKAAKGA
jgi:hypothetical protein